VDAADQPRMVRWVTDRLQFDLIATGLENNGGAADGEFADPALAQATANDDALRVFPVFEAQKAPDDQGEFLREFLDDAVDYARRFRIAFGQRFVELLLAEVLAQVLAERILTSLADTLAPVVENRLEGPLACAIADEAIGAPQLGIVGVHDDVAELLGAVSEQRGRRASAVFSGMGVTGVSS